VNQSGTGLAAILHADYSLVDENKPAVPGEVVSIFLTGMGAVNPPVADGTAGGADPVSRTTASPLYVLVGGQLAPLQFSGLAPGYPGLYQINVRLPLAFPARGSLPLAIQTGNAFHDQVDIAVR
jgi:uncharacterized protein (TIGR03437 family)